MSHRCYIYKHFVFFRCHRHYTLIFHVFSELCRLLLLRLFNISLYPPYNDGQMRHSSPKSGVRVAQRSRLARKER